MLEGGLAENHDACEINGVLVEGTTDPNGEVSVEEQLNKVATLDDVERAFGRSPVTLVRDLEQMSNLFDFYYSGWNKLRPSLHKMILNTTNLTVKDKLSPLQEQVVLLIQQFIERMTGKSLEAKESEERRFQLTCQNCPRHRCGVFDESSSDEDGEVDEDMGRKFKTCTFCPVHKCVNYFNNTKYQFGGRPNKGKSERRPAPCSSNSKTEKGRGKHSENVSKSYRSPQKKESNRSSVSGSSSSSPCKRKNNQSHSSSSQSANHSGKKLKNM